LKKKNLTVSDQASFENDKKKQRLKKNQNKLLLNLLIQSCVLQIPISKLSTANPKETMSSKGREKEERERENDFYISSHLSQSTAKIQNK